MDLAALETQLDLGTGGARPWAVVAPPSPPKRGKAKPSNGSAARPRAARRARRPPPPRPTPRPLRAAPAPAKPGRDPDVPCLEPEVEEGNVEFKLMLSDSNPSRYEQLITQLKYRLAEGRGEAFYYIGVEDDGYPRGLQPAALDASLATLRRMAAALGANATLVERMPGGFGLSAALVRVQRDTCEEVACAELRVAVAGGTGSGKSTLTATLTHGADGRPHLDDGLGRARMAVLRHKHEIRSGRTSSVGQSLLGYDGAGRVLNYAGVTTPPTPAEVCAAAARAVTFLDLGGHHAFLKTTLFGLTSLMPDYALLCVCAPAGVTPTTRQHLALAVALDVPAALVVTKCDAAAPGRLAATMAEVAALAADAAAPHTAANPGGEAVAGAGAGALLEVGSEAAAAAAAQELSELRAAAPGAHAHAPAQRRFPVFRVSSVTGTGLDSLHAFLSRLRPAARGGEGEGAGDGGAGEEAAGGGGLREGRLLLMEGAGAAGGSAASSGTPRGCGSSSGLSSSTSSDAGGEGEGEARRRGAAAAAPPLAGGAAARGAGAGRHFQVFHTFDVEGVAVACGICVEGGVTLGQRLLWGPTEDGGFVPAVVTGIQRGQVPVRVVRPGQTATLALEPPAAHHAGGGAGGAGAERDAAVAAAAAADAVRRCQEQHRRARAKSQIEAEVLALRSEYGSSFCSGGGGGVGSSDPPGGPPAPARGGAGGPPSGGGGSDSSRAASDGGVAGVGGFCGALDAAADALADLLASDGGSDGGGGEFGCEGAHGGDDFDLLGSFDLGSAEERGGSASSCGSSGSSGSSCTAAAAAAALVGAGRSGAPATPPPPAPLGVQRSAPVPVPAAPPAGGLAAGDGTLLGCSPSSARKGGVLLGASAAPRTHWEFEAALMLLGGSWRPRASGASSGDEPCSSGGGDAPARGRARRRRGARELCFVVHCGSVRQVARVVELSDAPAACGCGDSCHGDGCSGGCGRRTPAALPASIATAAALLRGARGAGSAGAPGGGDAATARFRFVHRPEWLRPGARVILRDRSDGHVAAAGCITQLSP